MAAPTTAFCSEAWIIIIGYIANVRARAAELAIKAEALETAIFNGLFTPGVITPELLAQVLTSQEHVEKDLTVNITIEEKLADQVRATTVAYLKADKT